MTNNDKENIENIERAILGMIFLGNLSVKDNLLDKGIKADFFYNEKHKNIFSALSQMQAANINVDFMTFNSYITSNHIAGCGDAGYIAGLTNELPSTANADYYINQFIENYRNRIAKEKIQKLYTDLQNNKTSGAKLDGLIQELNDLNNNVFYELTASDYEKNNAFNDLCYFVDDIENGNTTPPIKTGFDNLDTVLDGGLYTGLYSIGALSSAGKTTLCLQIADQIAKAGNDVLIFSLEMAKKELLAKSLSRTTYQLNKINAITTRQILRLNKQELGNDKINNLNNALQDYGKYSKNIFFNIGIGDIGTDKIRKVINTHIHHRNKKPIVFIDYLQILAPPSDRLTDKQVIDKNIVELKRIARDFDIPVFVISSFNRDSYKKEVSLASFKESGAIEYTADVLIGLQPLGMSDKEDENTKLLAYNESLAGNGREIAMDIKVLKYRTGAKGKTELLYKPMFETYRAPQKEETRKYLLADINAGLNKKDPAPVINKNIDNFSKKGKQNYLSQIMNNNDEED